MREYYAVVICLHCQRGDCEACWGVACLCRCTLAEEKSGEPLPRDVCLVGCPTVGCAESERR